MKKQILGTATAVVISASLSWGQSYYNSASAGTSGSDGAIGGNGGNVGYGNTIIGASGGNGGAGNGGNAANGANGGSGGNGANGASHGGAGGTGASGGSGGEANYYAGGGGGGGGQGGEGGYVGTSGSSYNVQWTAGNTYLDIQTYAGAGGAGGAGGNGGVGGNGGSGDSSDVTGGDGGAGGSGGGGGSGANGGAGGNINFLISSSGNLNGGVYLKSDGGRGGNGGAGGFGGNGGLGGVVTGTNASNGSVGSVGNGSNGGNGGKGTDAGDISGTNNGKLIGYGITARSNGAYGGDGGVGGYGIINGNGGNGGNAGNGGTITITNTGLISTSGVEEDGAGIQAYSYGGNGGSGGNGVINGNGGNGGNGGDINITNTGTILVSGSYTYAIYTISDGGSYGGGLVNGNAGNSGDINITTSGTINVTGYRSGAIYLRSTGNNEGDLTVKVDGYVSGGYYAPAIEFDGGNSSLVTITANGTLTSAQGVFGTAVLSNLNDSSNSTINNYGTLIGSVNLVGYDDVLGSRTVNNYGTFYAGSEILLRHNGGDQSSVYNAGLFLPGGPNTIMQTDVDGNFYQSETGVTGIKIGGTNNYDTITVTGTTGGGGTLRTYQFDGYVPNPGNTRLETAPDTFRVITSGTYYGLAYGQFDDFYAKNYLVKLNPTLSGSTVVLYTTQSSFGTLFNGYKDGLTPNQRATAKALDKAIASSVWNGGSDSRAEKLISHLDDLSKSSLRGVLDQIAPEELGGLVDTGLGVVYGHELNVLQRLDQTRLAALSYPPAVGDKEGKAVAPLALGDRSGFYASGNFNGAKIDDQDGIKGYHDDTFGGTIGYDTLVSDSVRLGIAGSYIYSNLNFTKDGKADVNNGTASLYGSFLSGGFHLDGLLGCGGGSYDITRSGLDNKKTTGSTDAAEFHALLGAGYDVPVGHFTLTPKANLAYTHLWLDGYTESGSLAPLKVDSFGNTESLKLRVGTSVAYNAEIASHAVTPELGIYWQHEFLDTTRTVTSRLASGAGGALTVDSAAAGHDAILPTAAVNVKLSSHVDLRLAGEVAIADHSTSYNSLVSVSVGW